VSQLSSIQLFDKTQSIRSWLWSHTNDQSQSW
jgi:hypothetical protein